MEQRGAEAQPCGGTGRSARSGVQATSTAFIGVILVTLGAGAAAAESGGCRPKSDRGAVTAESCFIAGTDYRLVRAHVGNRNGRCGDRPGFATRPAAPNGRRCVPRNSSCRTVPPPFGSPPAQRRGLCPTRRGEPQFVVAVTDGGAVADMVGADRLAAKFEGTRVLCLRERWTLTPLEGGRLQVTGEVVSDPQPPFGLTGVVTSSTADTLLQTLDNLTTRIRSALLLPSGARCAADAAGSAADVGASFAAARTPAGDDAWRRHLGSNDERRLRSLPDGTAHGGGARRGGGAGGDRRRVRRTARRFRSRRGRSGPRPMRGSDGAWRPRARCGADGGRAGECGGGGAPAPRRAADAAARRRGAVDSRGPRPVRPWHPRGSAGRRFVLVRERPGATCLYETEAAAVVARVGPGPVAARAPSVYLGLRLFDVLAAEQLGGGGALPAALPLVLRLEARAIETGYSHLETLDASDRATLEACSAPSASPPPDWRRRSGWRRRAPVRISAARRQTLLGQLNARRSAAPLDFDEAVCVSAMRTPGAHCPACQGVRRRDGAPRGDAPAGGRLRPRPARGAQPRQPAAGTDAGAQGVRRAAGAHLLTLVRGAAHRFCFDLPRAAAATACASTTVTAGSLSRRDRPRQHRAGSDAPRSGAPLVAEYRFEELGHYDYCVTRVLPSGRRQLWQTLPAAGGST